MTMPTRLALAALDRRGPCPPPYWAARRIPNRSTRRPTSSRGRGAPRRRTVPARREYPGPCVLRRRKLLATAHLADYPLAYVELWEVATGKRHGRLTTPTGAGVTCLAFSPRGKLLAAGDNRNHVWLSDLATGKEPARPEGPLRPVSRPGLAPDGKTLASCAGHPEDGGDAAVRFWDVVTGQPLRELLGHQRSPKTLAFLKGGELVWPATTPPCGSGTPPLAGRSASARSKPKRSAPAARALPDGKTVALLILKDREIALELWERRGGQAGPPFCGRSRVPIRDRRFARWPTVGHRPSDRLELRELASGKYSCDDRRGPGVLDDGLRPRR